MKITDINELKTLRGLQKELLLLRDDKSKKAVIKEMDKIIKKYDNNTTSNFDMEFKLLSYPQMVFVSELSDEDYVYFDKIVEYIKDNDIGLFESSYTHNNDSCAFCVGDKVTMYKNSIHTKSVLLSDLIRLNNFSSYDMSNAGNLMNGLVVFESYKDMNVWFENNIQTIKNDIFTTKEEFNQLMPFLFGSKSTIKDCSVFDQEIIIQIE